MPRLETVLAVAVLTLVPACRQPPPPSTEEPAGARLEHPEIGLALAAVPEIFRIDAMDETGIVLELVEGQGHLEIVPGDAETGINMVAAVEAHKEEILGRPGGEYKGGRELVVEEFPGAAYYSRGRFEGEAGPTEETVVFLIHPWKDRKLRVIYTYPAGDDSPARLQDQLFAVVEELRGMPRPEDADGATEGGAETASDEASEG